MAKAMMEFIINIHLLLLRKIGMNFCDLVAIASQQRNRMRKDCLKHFKAFSHCFRTAGQIDNETAANCSSRQSSQSCQRSGLQSPHQ